LDIINELGDLTLEQKQAYNDLSDGIKGSVINNIELDRKVNNHYNNIGERKKAAFVKLLKERLKLVLIGFIYFCIAVNLVVYSVKFLIAFLNLEPGHIEYNAAYYVFWMFLTIITWLFSTKYDYFNIHMRKMFGVVLWCANITVFLTSFIFLILSQFLVPLVHIIPVSRDITPSMLKNLVRVLCAYAVVFFSFFVFRSYMRVFFHKFSKEVLYGFKFEKYFDRQRYSKYAYNMSIIKKLSTGGKFVVREKERYQHCSFNGVTGTGKTSMCISVAFLGDILQRMKNLNVLKKFFERLLNKGKVVLKKPIDDKEFTVHAFEATSEKTQKKIDKMLNKVRPCGITAMAPNTAFADELSELCYVRNIKVNRVDPMLDPNHESWVGFNPLFISPGSSGLERRLEIAQKSILMADVLQALFELGGNTDPYFVFLNRSVTTSTSMLVCETADEVLGRQATVEDVQAVINDFTKARKYVDVLKKRDREEGNYAQVISLIEQELLGPGAVKLVDQARGLRTMFQELLSHPLVKRVLCSQKTLDLDEALKNGEITVVNYPLELGQNVSAAFGMFFALNFNSAVLRRPRAYRFPHFYYVDEFPVIIHPRMETCFSLFRQYMVSTNVAIQTLQQCEKTAVGKVFKSLLTGSCGTQVIYGGIALEEMKLYEELAGEISYIAEQRMVSESSLSLENASYSYGVRLQEATEHAMTGREMRLRDFKEVTVLSKRNGHIIDLFAGMTGFLTDYDRLKGKNYFVKWANMYDGDKADGTQVVDVVDESIKETDEDPVICNIDDNLDVVAKINSSNDEQPLFNDLFGSDGVDVIAEVVSVDMSADKSGSSDLDIVEDEEGVVQAEVNREGESEPNKDGAVLFTFDDL